MEEVVLIVKKLWYGSGNDKFFTEPSRNQTIFIELQMNNSKVVITTQPNFIVHFTIRPYAYFIK